MELFRWRCVLFVFFLFACCSQEIRAEAFTIKHYDVRIQLNSDGSFHVTETIDLRFHEARRGIMRNIPIIYQQGGSGMGHSERAIRPLGPNTYQIVIEDIDVQGHPFTHYREGNNKIIRIGNPNKTLRGNQRYIISYTVWGGLNEFEETVEWPWNIIGNEWDAPIEKVSFEISAVNPLQFSEKDLVIATGRRGMTAMDVQLQISGQLIKGESTRPLRPYEGISIVTRHPKSAFENIQIPIQKLAGDFWIENHQYSFTVVEPGYVKVTEEIDIQVINPVKSISRLVAYTNEITGRETPVFPYLSRLEVSMGGGEPIRAVWDRTEQFTRVEIQATEGASFSGRKSIRLDYEIWGVDYQSVSGVIFRLFPAYFLPSAPVERLIVNGQAENTESFTFIAGNHSATRNSFDQPYAFRFEYPSVRPEYGALMIRLSEGIYQEDFQPIQVFGWNYVVSEMDVRVGINKRQLIEIDREYRVVNSYQRPVKNFEPVYPVRFKRHSDFFESGFIPSNWNLLDNRVKPIVRMEAEAGNFTGISSGYRKLKVSDKFLSLNEWRNADRIAYSGLATKKRETNEDQFLIPVISKTTEPIRNFTIKVLGEELASRDLVRASLRIGERSEVPLEFKDGNWVLRSPVSLSAGESVVLSISGPKGFAGQLGWGDRIYLVLKNNIPIWLIGFVGGLLYFLWNKIGRNEKEAVVVHFYPPETITSAEAGLLWDDKLHRKDLVSLVYYWAGKGYLEVEEIGEGKKTDYLFRKLKELPNEARLFEKTFFKGLFIKDEVKLSELKHRFASTMRHAHKDLMDHSKRNDFYVPGSRGFGCALMSLGVVVLLFGVFGLGIAFFTGYWSYAVAPLSIATLMLIFGKKMPKKGPFGFKKYQKLLGFREFVRTAEIDRIKALYKENPGYFDKTIAYAIVFGLGKQWAEKFEGLMTEPPSWYKTSRRADDFSTIYFTNALIRSMHRMNYNMSLPAASTAGGGSSWSGGGGSGFGGSFGSGGGFGGGGGSSW